MKSVGIRGRSWRVGDFADPYKAMASVTMEGLSRAMMVQISSQLAVSSSIESRWKGDGVWTETS